MVKTAPRRRMSAPDPTRGEGLTAVKSRLKRKAPRRRKKKKAVVVPVEKTTEKLAPDGLDQSEYIV